MTQQTNTTAIVLFAKKPEVGRVKTRLAADVGGERAVAIYKELVAGTVAQARGVRAADIWLYYAPPEAEAYMRAWQGGLHYAAQCDGDLGDRLLAAFADCTEQGYAETIIIGTDCPGLRSTHLEEALAGLKGEADLVLGPTFDGGYYLVAAQQPIPELFVDMPWSTEAVFDETMQRARARGLQVELLERLRDVDTRDDLEALL